jgi:hypothetical protein
MLSAKSELTTRETTNLRMSVLLIATVVEHLGKARLSNRMANCLSGVRHGQYQPTR